MLNEHFVCIKVDREERPDIDHIYMTALNVMRQQRRLAAVDVPHARRQADRRRHLLAAARTAKIDGETIRGFKTHPARSCTRPGQENPKDVDEQADKLAERDHATPLDAPAAASRWSSWTASWSTRPSTDCKDEFDPESRRLRQSRPQVPRHQVPHAAAPGCFLQQRGRADQGEGAARAWSTLTLDQMARGGIYDHLGGGFHRYSTERTWTVPHFEKMLYDNAQLVEVYAQAYRATEEAALSPRRRGDARLRRARDDSPEGGVLLRPRRRQRGRGGPVLRLDAEGAGEPSCPTRPTCDLFRKVYGADGRPNFEEKYHILTLPKPLAETGRGAEADRGAAASEARAAEGRSCSTARRSATRPFLDTKVLTAWNGQMIAGYAEAGQVLERARSTSTTAAKAADFVLRPCGPRTAGCCALYGAAPGQKPQGPRQRLPRRLRLPGPRPARACTTPPSEKTLARRGEGADRHDDQVPRRQEARRLLLHVQRPREALRPRQGPVRRRPAVRQQRGGPQPGAPVEEDRRQKYRGSAAGIVPGACLLRCQRELSAPIRRAAP